MQLNQLRIGLDMFSNSHTHLATCSNTGFSYLADDFAFTEQCYEVDDRRFVRRMAENVENNFMEMLKELV